MHSCAGGASSPLGEMSYTISLFSFKMQSLLGPFPNSPKLNSCRTIRTLPSPAHTNENSHQNGDGDNKQHQNPDNPYRYKDTNINRGVVWTTIASAVVVSSQDSTKSGIIIQSFLKGQEGEVHGNTVLTLFVKTQNKESSLTWLVWWYPLLLLQVGCCCRWERTKEVASEPEDQKMKSCEPTHMKYRCCWMKLVRRRTRWPSASRYSRWTGRANCWPSHWIWLSLLQEETKSDILGIQEYRSGFEENRIGRIRLGWWSHR